MPQTPLRTATAICLACGLCNATANDDRTCLDANKAVVRAYMTEVINNGKLDAYETYFSSDVVFNGQRQVKQQLARRQAMNRAFPDHRVTVDDQIAEGDRVVTRVTFTGTHLGDFNGIAPTGRFLRYSGIAIDRIVDGKVVEMWHLASPLGLPAQLDAVLRAPVAPTERPPR